MNSSRSVAGHACAATSFPFCATARIVASISRKIKASTSSPGNCAASWIAKTATSSGSFRRARNGSQSASSCSLLTAMASRSHSFSSCRMILNPLVNSSPPYGRVFSKLQHDHPPQFLAIRRGEPHSLHQHGAHRQRKPHCGAIGHRRGSLLHGCRRTRGLSVDEAAHTPAIRGGHDRHEAGPWRGRRLQLFPRKYYRLHAHLLGNHFHTAGTHFRIGPCFGYARLESGFSTYT